MCVNCLSSIETSEEVTSFSRDAENKTLSWEKQIYQKMRKAAYKHPKGIL